MSPCLLFCTRLTSLMHVTLRCGTGSCSSADVYYYLTKVHWRKKNGRVIMPGSATGPLNYLRPGRLGFPRGPRRSPSVLPRKQEKRGKKKAIPLLPLLYTAVPVVCAVVCSTSIIHLTAVPKRRRDTASLHHAAAPLLRAVAPLNGSMWITNDSPLALRIMSSFVD